MELRELKGYEGYFASDDGHIYSCLGQGNRHNGKTVDLYKLSDRPLKSGYCQVLLRPTGSDKRVYRYVHRLVAEAFLEKPEGRNVINHKNYIKSDNRVSNLEWVTQKENIAHCRNQGRLYNSPTTGRFTSGLK